MTEDYDFTLSANLKIKNKNQLRFLRKQLKALIDKRELLVVWSRPAGLDFVVDDVVGYIMNVTSHAGRFIFHIRFFPLQTNHGLVSFDRIFPLEALKDAELEFIGRGHRHPNSDEKRGSLGDYRVICLLLDFESLIVNGFTKKAWEKRTPPLKPKRTLYALSKTLQMPLRQIM